MLKDTNDYPAPLPQRALRSALFRSGISERLGPRYWQPTDEAPYISVPYRRPLDMFSGIPTQFADAAFNAMIGPDSARWSHVEETVTTIDDCWVEPNRCQIIGPDGRLVKQSLTHRFVPLFPSVIGYVGRQKSGRKVSEALVYDGFNSTNYYHHLIDTLPSVVMHRERSGLPLNLPFLVNRWIYESRFFAYLRERSRQFSSINWIVQEPGEWIHLDRAYRLHAAPYCKRTMQTTRALYGRISQPKSRRIFLSRDPAMYSRGLLNEKEVSALLKKHGFETIYAEHLTLEDQQRTFEEATHLVALHGMGLVQQIFMDPSQGHVLEIMPRNRLHSVYYWQAWTQGMRYYDVQTGSAMDAQGQYDVNLDELALGVARMLSHPPHTARCGETSQRLG